MLSPAPYRVLVLCVVGLGLAAGCSDDEPRAVNVGESAVGTCLDFSDGVRDEVTRLPAVECDAAHTHEIFAVERVDADTYPGLDELEGEAQALCLGAFEEYVGINPIDSDFFVSWLVPTLTSWDRENDREIICVAGEAGDAPLVGSIRDVAR